MLKGASASRGPSLSKAWEVVKAHRGAYSGGKVELSADGTFLACLYEADVSFLDVDRGEVTRKLRQDEENAGGEEIVCFALHPTSEEIVTASRNLLLRHWDLSTGECRRSIRAHDLQVLCMDYDSSGTLVATGSSDRTVKVFDVERGYCTHNFKGHTGIVSVVAFHPAEERLLLLSGSEDASIRVWDLSKQACAGVLLGHMSTVTSLAFLDGGNQVITGGRDRVLNVWDIKRSVLLKTVPVYEEVEGLQVLPRDGEFYSHKKSDQSGSTKGFPVGRRVAVAGSKGVLRVFELEFKGSKQSDDTTSSKTIRQAKKLKTGKRSSDFDSKAPPKVSCRCVMTQNNRAASHKAGYTSLLLDGQRGGLIGVTADHNIVLLGAAERRDEAAGVVVSKRQIVGYNDEIIDIKHMPQVVRSAREEGEGEGEGNGDSWVAVATNSPQVRLFELGGFSSRLLDGHTQTVLALDVAPDGRHLCTSSKDRCCLLWDLELGVPVVRWTGHTDAIGAVASSRRPGPWALTAGGSFVVSGAADRTLKRWDVPHKSLVSLEAEARASRTSMTSAGEVLDSEGGGNKGVGAWNPPEALVGTVRVSVRAHEKDINCVVVAPNDGVVASGSQDHTIKLWRAGDLELVGVLKGHKRGVWKVEFSPVDRCLASCSGDRTVKVWSVSDFSCLRTFQGHTASVLSVAFVSAGAQLISGGADGLLKLWTIRSDECEATLDAHTDKVWALATAEAPMSLQTEETNEDGDDGDTGNANKCVNSKLVVVSGGADSVINVWRDITVREEEKVIAERELALLKEQELLNKLRDKDYGPAIELALELRRPQRLWSVLRATMTEELDGANVGNEEEEVCTEMSSRRLDDHVVKWDLSVLGQCLSYCKDWNTNARRSVVVQALLGSILRCVGLSSLKKVEGCGELVRGLLPYSDRHFQRLDRLLQSSYLVEHTLSSMRLLIADPSAPGGSSEISKQGGRTGVPSILGENGKGSGGSVGAMGGSMIDRMEDSSDEEEEGGLSRDKVIIGDRVVFNVAPAAGVDKGDSGRSGKDSDEYDSDEMDMDVKNSKTRKRKDLMSERVSNCEGTVEVDRGRELEGDDRTSVRKSKKRRKKAIPGERSDKGGGNHREVVLGLVLPTAETCSSAVTSSSKEMEGPENDVSNGKMGKKKKGRRSAGGTTLETQNDVVNVGPEMREGEQLNVAVVASGGKVVIKEVDEGRDGKLEGVEGGLSGREVVSSLKRAEDGGGEGEKKKRKKKRDKRKSVTA